MVVAGRNKDRNYPTKTMSMDGETILGNFHFDMDRKVFDNNPLNVNLRDFACDVCKSDDHKERKVGEVELPMLLETFAGCCMNLTNYLWQAYQRLKVCRSDLSHEASECFDFSSRVLDDLIGFGFFVAGQHWQLLTLSAVSISVI